MDDIRRLKALRAKARASYYCCLRAASLAAAGPMRETIEQAAAVRWRLARAIDTYLTSQPWEDHSRLGRTLRDRATCLGRRLRAMLVRDRDRHALRWIAADSADLRHAIEISRGLSWSLEISDLLTPRLEEIRHLQRAIAALQAPPATRRDSTVSEGQEPLAAA